MDAIYLRKSRLDLDAERSGNGNTLSRHKNTLTALAQTQHREIGAIYEEVRSGDAISSRPEMQRLLHDVEENRWDAVLVMEVERLARGDSIDQGIVAQAFKYSGTKIITPMKTYDPQNEFDEEFFEFGLFMSRREYKTIKRRLAAGHVAAVREGKYPGKTAPIGYRRVRMEKAAGWTLEVVPEQAAIVRRIFDLAARGCGLQKTARTLNAAHLYTARGNVWSESTVRSVLENVTYRGDVCWGRRPSVKLSKDGMIRQSRPLSENYLICQGLHEAIVSREQFAEAQRRRSETPSPPLRQGTELRNPFCGVLYCRNCGHKMQLVSKTSGCQSYTCRNLTCDTPSTRSEIIETAVYDSLGFWLINYSAEVGRTDISARELEQKELYSVHTQLLEQLEQLDDRLRRAYDMLEQRIYEPDEFLQRRAAIETQRAAVRQSLLQNNKDLQAVQECMHCLPPALPHRVPFSDVWSYLKTPAERNAIIRLSLKRIDYAKVGKYSDTAIQIWIYPLLPEA